MDALVKVRPLHPDAAEQTSRKVFTGRLDALNRQAAVRVRQSFRRQWVPNHVG